MGKVNDRIVGMLSSGDKEMVEMGANLLQNEYGMTVTEIEKLHLIDSRFSIFIPDDSEVIHIIENGGYGQDVINLWAMKQKVDAPLLKLRDFGKDRKISLVDRYRNGEFRYTLPTEENKGSPVDEGTGQTP